MLHVRRHSDNVISVVLGVEEAIVIRSLPDRLRRLLQDPEFNERVTRRLFPSAYADRRDEEEYRRLLGDDLARRKHECIDAFENSLRTCRVHKNVVEILIEPAEFDLWLGFVNDTRLMLGTELDIRDDDWGSDFDFDHPHAEDLALLHFLTWLEEELLRGGGFEMPEIDPEQIRNMERKRRGKKRKKRED